MKVLPQVFHRIRYVLLDAIGSDAQFSSYFTIGAVMVVALLHLHESIALSTPKHRKKVISMQKKESHPGPPIWGGNDNPLGFKTY